MNSFLSSALPSVLFSAFLFCTTSEALAQQPDKDGDGVPDIIDNCIDVSNSNQKDSDKNGFGDICDADINKDGIVNALDLSLLRIAFGTNDAPSDLNGDGVVNAVDLAILRNRFGQAPGPTGLPHFQAGQPGLFAQQTSWRVALPVINAGNGPATEVSVQKATLEQAGTGVVLTPSLGKINANDRAVLETDFASPQVAEGTLLSMTVAGSYRWFDRTFDFLLNRKITAPPSVNGSRNLNVVRIDAQPTPCREGRCSPLNTDNTEFEEEEVNQDGPPVPTGIFNPPIPSTVTQEPRAAPPAPGPGAVGGIFFNQTVANAPNPNSLFSGIPPDMSGGSSTTSCLPGTSECKHVVLMTGNTFLAYSVDAGATFPDTQIVRPNNVYSDRPDGGFCCDQIIQYVPKIDRYVWLIQTRRDSTGPNRLRIALASPEQIVNSGGLAWTYYDITSATLGIGSNWLDYPDMAVGDNFLYFSVDQVGTGLIVGRIPLADLGAGVGTTVEFTAASDGGSAYGGHLSQNALNSVYWAGHNSSSNLRVFWMPEGDNHYFWQSLDINSWANSNYVTTAPDGLDWLAFGFPRSSVLGAVRRSEHNDVWFAWSAGRDAAFPQPHVEMLRLTRNGDGSVAAAGQVQIWNASLAFQYPSLSTDVFGDLAVAVSWGGGPDGHYGSFAVGFWGDFVVYYIDASTLTAAYDVSDTATPPNITNQPRWGDYITVRAAANPLSLSQFTAYGYAVKTDASNRDSCKTVLGVSTGCRFEPQFIRFEYQQIIIK